MTLSKLDPCPYCPTGKATWDKGSKGEFIRCMSCKAATGETAGPERTATIWNMVPARPGSAREKAKRKVK